MCEKTADVSVPGRVFKKSTSIQIYAAKIHPFSFKNLMRKDSFVKWRSKNNIA